MHRILRGLCLVSLVAACGGAGNKKFKMYKSVCRNVGSHVLGVHLAISTQPTELTVAWHTDGAVCGKPCVHWGIAELDRYLDEEAIEQNRAHVSCGETQEYLVSPNASAYVYHATIGPLKPGVRYSYQVQHNATQDSGVNINDVFSPVAIVGDKYDFIAPMTDPTEYLKPQRKRVVFFGDSGHSEEWHSGTFPTVAAEVAAGTVSMIIHTGDMAYYAKDDSGQRGGTHAEELSNATGHVVPLMTVPGNGDVFCYCPPGCDSLNATN